MTRARWIVGGLIGLGALVVAGDALGAYLAERLIVGVVAVLVLAGVLVIGLASLGRARRYVAGEVASLAAEPPGGALLEARRTKLRALQGRGVMPDLDVLADATAAEEAERGYTGRYLVATTVLIGLVGTFGGLMETMARVGPLLKGSLGAGGEAGVLALVAAPLGGLHVTFGTSVVAILVTLALALIQGDVTLHHERMLALLQERTRHVLMPELWPAGDSAAERTVQRLDELRGFLEQALTKGAAAGAEKIGAQVATVIRAEVARLVEQVGADTRAASAAQTAALQSAGAATTASLRQTAEATIRELREATGVARDALVAATAGAHETIAAAAARSHEAIAAVAARSHETITAAGAKVHETIVVAADRSHDTLAAAAASSREATSAAVSTSLAATVTAAEALREAVAAATTASGQAIEQVASATRELTTSTVEALTLSSARSSEAFATSTTAVVEALGGSSSRTSEAFTATTAAAVEALAQAGSRSAQAFTVTAAAAVEALAQSSARSSEAFTATTAAAIEALAQAGNKSAEAFTTAAATTVETLALSGHRSSEAFTSSTAAAVQALGEVRSTLGGELARSSTALATAAQSLHGSLEALAPQLGSLASELAPQLAALTAEVALLAARAENPEEPNAILDELVRLGEDVERLVASRTPDATVSHEAES